jgi:signal peptidase II
MGPWGILVVVGAVVLADRVSKTLAVHRLVSTPGGRGVFRLVISDRLPLAADTSSRALVALWIAAALSALAAMALLSAGHADPLVSAGLAVALAGAFCNLCDRLGRGSVIDFIAIGWWPVFNLADVAIVTGGLVAALSLV